MQFLFAPSGDDSFEECPQSRVNQQSDWLEACPQLSVSQTSSSWNRTGKSSRANRLEARSRYWHSCSVKA